MKILIISMGTDPAGVGMATKLAFDRHTDLEVRFVQRVPREYEYPRDIVWGLTNRAIGDQVVRLFAEADVVHMIDVFADLPGWERKPRILQHHGSWLQKQPKLRDRARAEGVTQIVTTHDIAEPDMPWVPNPCPIEEFRAIRRNVYQPGPVRVMQNPSAPDQKQTDVLLKAWPTAEIVTGVTWAESLRRKAQADVMFDSFTFGYGNTSIEAMAMGIPVVSGVSDPAIEGKMREHIGFLPYYPATPETLSQRIREMVDDPALRHAVSEAGRECVERFHDERVVVRRLLEVYERAMDVAVAA